jgi:hypothetical protein
VITKNSVKKSSGLTTGHFLTNSLAIAYKIGNFAYVTELDDFLQDPKFFDKQFLKAAPTRPRIP